MEQPIAEAGGSFERMSERMAKVEQGPFAGFSLIAYDDRRFSPATPGDGLLAGWTAAQHLRPVDFQPGEKPRIIDQPVFYQFGISGPKCPPLKGIEHGGIGHDEAGLVKRADQVLTVPRIDRGLAP